jgi:Peptidase family M28
MADELDGWIRRLAAIERPSASEGERRAAEWILGELASTGVDGRIEAERANGTHLPFMLSSALALAAGFVRRRAVAILSAAIASAAITDELDAGRRLLRRSLARRQTYNVVAELGDPSAPRTVVFVSHHDAARPWGVLFGALVSVPPRFLKGRLLPVMASLIYAPLTVLAGGVTGRRLIKLVGMATCALQVAVFADISRRKPVPGANDNASGVAVVLGLAHDLTRRPPRSLRVLLVSTGSEETGLEGMDGFLRRHRSELDPVRTLVVCLDQIGWEELVLRDSEGVLRRFRNRREDQDAVLAAAASVGVPLRIAPPFTPSDGLAARWAGIPTVFISSVAGDGGYPHYHRPSDVPENVVLRSVAGARRICAALVERLDEARG